MAMKSCIQFVPSSCVQQMLYHLQDTKNKVHLGKYIPQIQTSNKELGVYRIVVLDYSAKYE